MRLPASVVAEAQAAVDKGAAVLDRRRPRWFTQINCKTLDLSDTCDCVLGQLYDRYGESAISKALGRAFNWLGASLIRNAERHGFCSTPAMDKWAYEGDTTYNARIDACYHLLDRLWIAKITERLGR